MNVLEKILEEIEKLEDEYLHEEHSPMFCMGACSMAIEVKEIIRTHMDEVNNNGWIPVDVKLPEINKMVIVTVYTSEWISDFDSEWVRKEEKSFHQESCGAYLGRRNENGEWIFWDEEMGETICDKEFGADKGCCYSKVIAWKPLSEPYRPAEE